MFWSAWSLAVLLGLQSRVSHCREKNWHHPEDGVEAYITRPDIISPKWDIKYYDKDAISPGYWFLAPYEKVGETDPGGAWVGPHIYDGEGALIWSGSYLWDNINIMDFQVSNVRGEDRLALMFPAEAEGIILDNHYEELERFNVGITGSTLNMHELNFVDNGSNLLLLKRNITRASEEVSKEVGYEGNCQVMFHGFEEIDTTTWESKFTWQSSEHIPLSDSTMEEASVENRCENQWWDYIHLNAADKFTDGNYLLSARHTDTIYKISKDTGDIIWRLGGKKSDFEMLDGLNFSRQHHARFRGQNETHTLVSLLDNAKGQDAQLPSSDWSRALLLALRTDVQPMTAEIVHSYDQPNREYAHRRGDYQILDNGNAFICWSEQGLQSEHTADGKILFQARMVPDWIGTYRAFKYDGFVGRPDTPPDIEAKAFDDQNSNGGTRTLVHVSWNGDTEVKEWRLYKTTEDGEPKVQVASRPRNGFETALAYGGFASYVVVEGVDKDGEALGRSEVLKTMEPANMSTPAVAAEIQWQQDVEGGVIGAESWASETKAVLFSPLSTFISGVVACAVVVFVFWRLRQSRIPFWHFNLGKGGQYARLPGMDADEADHDATTLDDVGDRDLYNKERDHNQYSRSGNSDDGDEPAIRDTARLIPRTPYMRQVSSEVSPHMLERL